MPAARRAHQRNDRDFVNHNGCVFDKDRVGQVRLWRQTNNLHAEAVQTIFISAMLLYRSGYINRLLIMKG